MATKADEVVDLDALSPDELERLDAEIDERLRAAGVQFPTASLDRGDRVTVKLRPKWLAFLVRTFRLDP